MVANKRAIILILFVIAGSIGVVALAYFSNTSTCSIGSGSSTVHFTIIESSTGYNDSKDHATPWPIISVRCGQVVTIHLQNNDTSESHGFEMDHYRDHEVVLGPGESYDVVFNATEIGSFRFFCTIPCVVHQFMLNGHFNVVR